MPSTLQTEVTGAREAVIHLSAYSRHIEDFRALWPDIVSAFVAREEIWFDSQGSSGGASPWPELSPAYADWKQRVHPGKPKLVLTGDLRSSFTDPARAKLAETDTMLVLGSNDPKAPWHQYGTGKMPPRPPLIPVIRLEAAIARLIRIWATYRPGFGSPRR